MIKYDVVCKKGKKQSKIYREAHLSTAILHAIDVKGNVVDRITGETVWSYEKNYKN